MHVKNQIAPPGGCPGGVKKREGIMRKIVFGGKTYGSVKDISLSDICDEIRIRKNKRAEDYVVSGGRLSCDLLEQFWDEKCKTVLAEIADLHD